MAIATVSEFKARYPKFLNAGEVLISKALEEAQLYVSEAAFGTRYALAVELKAAANLESMKYGQVSPLANKSEASEYQKRFEELCKLVPIKMMIL